MTSSPVTPDIEAARSSELRDDGQPYANPRRGFLFFLGFAIIGAGMAQLTPAILTISIKADQIDPKNGPGALSIVIAIGAILAIIMFPIFGRLSDRTMSRLGRRRPFLFLAVVLIALGAVGMFVSTTIPVLTIGWILTTVGYASATVAVTSLIPDQFAPLKRGASASLVGLSLPLGAVFGLFIAQLVSGHVAAQIFLPAGIAVIGILLFAIVLKDQPITAAERPSFAASSFLSTFWVNPAKNPSFAWAWWSRFLIFLGVAALNAYMVFFLVEELHFTFVSAGGAVFLATLVLTVAALIFAPIAGKISDRVNRRKPFVIVAAIVFAVGLSFAANAHTFGTFLVAVAITGVGQGIYFAVDIALVTQILPSAKSAGQALGVINLASNLPTSIVPAVAPAVLLIGATAANTHNYSALFLGGAIAGILGAIAVLPIRQVR